MLKLRISGCSFQEIRSRFSLEFDMSQVFRSCKTIGIAIDDARRIVYVPKTS